MDQQPVVERRPASVNLVAWVNVLSGGSTLFMAAVSALLTMLTGGLSTADLGLLPFRIDPALLRWEAAGAGIAVVLALWRLAAGVGLLRDRPWARSATLGYAVCAVLFVLASDAVVLHVAPVLLAQVVRQLGPADIMPVVRTALRAFAFTEMASAILVNGWMIAVLCLPGVKATLLRRQAAAVPSNAGWA